MRNKLQKLITTISIISLLSIRVMPVVAYDVPAAPTAPTAPEAPITEAVAPTPPPVPEAPTEPTLDEVITESQQEPQPEEVEYDEEENYGNTGSGDSTTTSSSDSQPATQAAGEQTGNQTQDGQSGSTEINTGDATNSVVLATEANSNLSAGVADDCCGAGSVSISNTDNGTGSTNSGSASITENNNLVQDNNANVINNLDQATTTGENSASKNTGGDSEITTGDANTSGTIVTSVNTNVDGVAVAEFNIADDHVGDIILDFGTGCIIGCDLGSTTLLNKDNGSVSDNTASLDQTQNNATFQTNEATVENNMTLSSNSGENLADKNTGGNTDIETGDANVSANALTFANNNLSGNVVFGVVNIFGDLVGDIILTDEFLNSLSCSQCGSDALLQNSGNGTDSQNNADANLVTNNETYQTNDVTIDNVILVDAETGKNTASKNTGGNSEIETGDTNIDANVLNVANSNVDGGTWWLVVINEAGNWIGRLLGSPDGSNLAGSEGTEFSINENGEITATNSGNGSGSENDAILNQINNNTTIQTNTANIVNNLNLSANTGRNSASSNTGGNSSITTGDVNIVANLVNFVNNNITGNGKLFVTVVNVFGSWIGDFVTPGSEQEEDQTTEVAQGSVSSPDQNSNSNNSSGSQGGSSGSTSQSSAGQSTSSNSNSNPVGRILAQNTSYTSPLFLSEQVVADSANNMDNVLGQTEVANKKMKINLAWVLLGLPILGFILLLKYRPSILAKLRRNS